MHASVQSQFKCLYCACMLVRSGVLPGYTALAGCKRFGDGMSLLGLQPDSPVPLPSGDGYR